jgi:hypothetical protein
MNRQMFLPIGLASFAAVAALTFNDAPLDKLVPRAGPLEMPAAPASPPPELHAATAIEPGRGRGTEPGPVSGPGPVSDSFSQPTPAAPTPRAHEPAARKSPVPRSRVLVERRALDVDKRIQRDAMNVVAALPNMTGQVGVESHDAIVRLSGWTLTPGQSLRVEKAVIRVKGVKQVRNEIRPRMGAITG